MRSNEAILDALKELHTAILLAEAEDRKVIMDQARRLLTVLVESGSLPQEILEKWDSINA